MKFSTDEGLYRLFPGLRIGVLVVEVNNTRYGKDHLDEVLADLQAHFSYDKPQNHPNVRVWREAFTKLGVSASKYPSSIEAIIRRALKGGPFPRINPVVDLYNAMSLKYRVPMGGHAIPPLAGDIVLGFAEGTENFMPMDAAEQERVEKGEVVYKDREEVLTRRWVWRQCEKDKVTEMTTSVFVPIDVMPGLAEGLIEKVMADMDECLKADGNGKIVHRDVLTKDHLTTTF
jgi:DNA/RNA-binding domain of Phe-tRNA-synthetase-like protein